MTIRKGYVDLPEGQVHYHAAEGAADAMPVVFFHQTASSGKMFYEVIDRLNGTWPCFAFDTPGFGGSFDPEGMPTLPDYANWLGTAMDAAGLDQAHIVGHHTGACIAVELAAAQPDRVLSLSLVGPVPLTADERQEFSTHFGTPFSPTEDGAYLQTTWEYLAGLGANSDLSLHHRELVDTVRAYYGRYQAYSAVWDQDFTALYQQLTCPLSIMCAPDDVLFDYFERAKRMRPDAEAFELKGSNFETDQDPDGVAAALKTFISGLSQPAGEAVAATIQSA